MIKNETILTTNDPSNIIISDREQIGVYYCEYWCGRFKKGIIPTRDMIEKIICDNGFYCCEVTHLYDCCVKLTLINIDSNDKNKE